MRFPKVSVKAPAAMYAEYDRTRSITIFPSPYLFSAFPGDGLLEFFLLQQSAFEHDRIIA